MQTFNHIQGISNFSGEARGKLKKKIFGLQEKGVRINQQCRKRYFLQGIKTLIYSQCQCMYIMEIVYYMKMTTVGLEQNPGMIIINVMDQINPSHVEQVLKKKNVNNAGIRLYNKLPNHFKI